MKTATVLPTVLLVMSALLLSACALPGGAGGAQSGWQTHAPLLHARAAHAVVADDKHIYVLGGTGEGGRPVLAVERFDGTSWHLESQLPQGGLNAPAALKLGEEIWLVGGFFTDTNIPTDQVWRYHTRDKTWRAGPSLPVARGGHGLALVDGVIHLAGGGNQERTLDEHLLLKPGASSWQVAAALPRAQGSPALAVLENRLYAIGGRSGYQDFGDVYEFQPGATAWRKLMAISPRGTAGAVGSCGRLWVFGGEVQARQAVLAEVLQLDPRNGQIQTGPALPDARNFARAVWYRGQVYVVGGSLTAGDSHAAQGSKLVQSLVLPCPKA